MNITIMWVGSTTCVPSVSLAKFRFMPKLILPIGLRTRMPYCFVEQTYPGVPRIPLREIEVGHPFFINQTEIIPLRVMHGRLPILGYRIGNVRLYYRYVDHARRFV